MSPFPSKRCTRHEPPMISLRPATPDDATILATLIDMAAEGIAWHLWSQSAAPGQSPLEIGIQRARRDSGGFSWRNATLAERDGQTLGMLLGYPLDDPYDTGDLNALPDYVRPLVELEALAPGSWYVNGLAVLPEGRGQGIGQRLLEHARSLARAGGRRSLSIIVSAANTGAHRLYARMGYRDAARRPAPHIPGLHAHEAWVLMTRPVDD